MKPLTNHNARRQEFTSVAKITAIYIKDQIEDIGSKIILLAGVDSEGFIADEEWYGSTFSDDLIHPYILEKNGDLNYGHADDDDLYIEHSDIRQHKIEEGMCFHIKDEHDEVGSDDTYIVVSVYYYG
jgi:hypothetical protein